METLMAPTASRASEVEERIRHYDRTPLLAVERSRNALMGLSSMADALAASTSFDEATQEIFALMGDIAGAEAARLDGAARRMLAEAGR